MPDDSRVSEYGDSINGSESTKYSLSVSTAHGCCMSALKSQSDSEVKIYRKTRPMMWLKLLFPPFLSNVIFYPTNAARSGWNPQHRVGSWASWSDFVGDVCPTHPPSTACQSIWQLHQGIRNHLCSNVGAQNHYHRKKITYFHVQVQLLADLSKRPRLCEDTGNPSTVLRTLVITDMQSR